MHRELSILGIERRLHALGIARLQAWHIHHGYHHRIAHNTLLGFVIQLGSLLRGALQTALRSEEHTSELQSLRHLVCRLLLEKKKKKTTKSKTLTSKKIH